MQIGRSGDTTMLNVRPDAIQAGYAENLYFMPVPGGTAVDHVSIRSQFQTTASTAPSSCVA